ncbi:MAG: hypothetical protein R3B48_08885 [Kofleriaceae bacterium]
MTRFALVVLLSLVGVVATTADASAKVPVIYQTGQDTFECGPLPEPFDKDPDLAGYKAGYLCDITGVFWSYFSVRNCKPAAVNGNSYADPPTLVEAIKAKYPESSMRRGIWNKYGWVLLALLVLGGIGIWIKEMVTGKKD